MKREMKKAVGAVLMAGVMATVPLGVPVRGLSMTGSNLGEPETMPFMISRFDLGENTMTVLLRDESVEHVSVVMKPVQDRYKDGYYDELAFTGMTEGEPGWGKEFLGFDTAGLPLDTELKMGVREGLDILRDGNGGVIYVALRRGGEYSVEKHEVLDCMMSLGYMDKTAYECRIDPGIWGIGGLSDESEDFVSEATWDAAYSFDENGRPTEYMYRYRYSTARKDSAPTSLPANVRSWGEFEAELDGNARFKKEVLNLKSADWKARIEAEGKLATAESRVGSLETEKNNLLNELGRVEEELWGREDEVFELKGLLGEKDGLIATKEALMAEKDAEIAQKDALIATKDEQIATRDTEISAKNELVEVKEAEIAGLNGKIDGLSGEIAGLEGEIAALKIELAGLAAENEKVVAEKDGLEAEKAVLVAQIDRLNAEKAGLEAEKAKLTREKEELTARNDELVKELRDSEARISELEGKLAVEQEEDETPELGQGGLHWSVVPVTALASFLAAWWVLPGKRLKAKK